MIAIATHAANGLNQQGEFVVIKRLLQAAHHRDFILQVALQMDGTPLLKVFRIVGGERQVGNHAQLAQHQIKMVNRGPDIAIAHAHLRLQRHAIPARRAVRRLRLDRDRHGDVDAWLFAADDAAFELLVLPSRLQRQAPLSPVDEKPMQRLSAGQLQRLLDDDQADAG